ncbi:MAG: dihydroorotase [Firmicutes bacterium]|nr:dihydroorotase [Bacillota bacterium]
MGTLFIDRATVIDPFHDVFEEKDIAVPVEGADRHIDGAGRYLFPSFVDVHVHFRDPGFPEKETLETGAEAALHGGYGHVVCMANTDPVMEGDVISDFYARAESLPVYAYTVSALTRGLKGEELVDMDDAIARGAVGFSDDGLPLKGRELLKEALDKAKSLDVPVSLHEEDPAFVETPGIDSRYAKAFGFKGAEAMAEYSLSARDLALAYRAGAKLDIQHISCGLTARLVSAFAASGGRVLGELTPHHLTMTGEDVEKYGALAKMNPPLRTAEDEAVLRTFVGDSHFAIATDHAPHTREEKKKSLEEAPSGIVGLETAFPLLYTELVLNGSVALEDLVGALTVVPANFYRLPHAGVAGGDFVVFNPDKTTRVDEAFFRGRSANSPLLGRTLSGAIEGIVVKGRYHAF